MNQCRARLLTEDREVLVESLDVWLEVTDAANRKWEVQFGPVDDETWRGIMDCLESLEFLRLEFEDGRYGTILYGSGNNGMWHFPGLSPLYDKS